MRVPRVLVREKLLPGVKLPLPTMAAQHVSQVLRLKSGAPLVLMDGLGQLAHAHIDAVSKRDVWVQIDDLFDEQRESPLEITLWQCLSRGDRMDYTLQKAVELGVTEIIPVMSERVNLRLDDQRLAKRYDHWQGIIDSAAMQSCRTHVPQLQPLHDLAAVCQKNQVASKDIDPSILTSQQTRLRLVLDPKANTTCRELTQATHIDLLVGCEGGLTDTELTMLQQAGFIGIRLGPRVLRTETAGIALLSLLQGLWGDLG